MSALPSAAPPPDAATTGSIGAFAVIDFEATSLGAGSTPIEVGVAVAFRAAGPVLWWSTLIAPPATWLRRGDWNPAAAAVHGIAAEDLSAGCPPDEVAAALDAIIAPLGHAWCDGGEYDAMWFGELYAAAHRHPAFGLRDLAMQLMFGRMFAARVRAELAGSAPPHRAGPDAARLAQALLVARHGPEVTRGVVRLESATALAAAVAGALAGGAAASPPGPQAGAAG